MKKILITGANSYIGTSFEKYIKENYSEEYAVDTIDMVDGTWKEKSFSGYDSVFHVAGIAHQKETKKNASMYYSVNRNLAIDTAKKAKSDGVKQFVFLSSMSVYGVEEGIINEDTVPCPKSNYGKSKLQAETEIIKLASDDFKTCILRPPMVYGNGCKGNYQALVKLAKITPIFPNYVNQRSMISVNNLSKAVKLYIDNMSEGIFKPQDSNYICTCEMVKQISEKMGKRMKLTKLLNPVVIILLKCSIKARKAFGNLTYQNSDEENESEKGT